MKIVNLIICVVIITQLSPAQFASRKIMDFTLPDKEENLVNKGDNFINVYYGPSISTGVYKRIVSASGTNLRISTIGNLGIVYEHLLTDIVGLGCEIGYTKLTMKYDVEYQNSNGVKLSGTEKLEIIGYRIAFRANFHFAKSDKLDAYGLVSAGYRGNSFKYTSGVPGGNVSYNTPSLIPFGVKPGIGLRYFFTPAFGINAEFAFGTPLICGGLSFKFK